MSFTILPADTAFWRPSNQMGVLNTDLARQLSADTLGARLWRLTPGQASTRHRHLTQHELYIVLEGTGRIRVESQLLTLTVLSALLIEPACVRQIFNDTDTDALWLIAGAPPEAANTLQMTPEQLAGLYPDGPQALAPRAQQPRTGPEPEPGDDAPRLLVPAVDRGVRVLVDCDAGGRGPGGQRRRRTRQLGQVAAVDGEFADAVGLALVDIQGAAILAQADVNCTDAPRGADRRARQQRQATTGRDRVAGDLARSGVHREQVAPVVADHQPARSRLLIGERRGPDRRQRPVGGVPECRNGAQAGAVVGVGDKQLIRVGGAKLAAKRGRGPAPRRASPARRAEVRSSRHESCRSRRC